MSELNHGIISKVPLRIISEHPQKIIAEHPQKIISEHPQKSKSKNYSLGSYCSARGCKNRSSRNFTSVLPNRDFLRYLTLPKKPEDRKAWLTRMKHNVVSKYKGVSLRVCTDHFFDNDFQQDDLARYRYLRLNGDVRSLKFCRIRLKPNTLPNTDRVTGRYADPLDYQRELRRRPLPNERGPQRNSAVTCAQQTCSDLNFIPIKFRLLNSQVESNEITARPGNNLSDRNVTTSRHTTSSFTRTSSVSTKSKGCQAGSAFIHQTQETTSRATEVDNFHELEILLGPEDLTEEEFEKTAPNSDPDWSDFEIEEDNVTDSDEDSEEGTVHRPTMF